ncbi:PhnA-like protein [Methylobacterium sp. A54F]
MTTIQTVAPPLPAEAHADTRAVLLNQVSWGAIFAGAVTALVTQVILNLVGVGVGLASVGTNAADNPAASTVSLSAGVWFVVSGIVASLAGGLIAGRLSGKTLPGAAALHGLVSWAVTTLVVLYLITSAASGLVGGTLSTVSGALGGAGNLVGGTVQTAAQAAAPSLSKISNPLDGIENTVRQQAAGQDPQAARDAAVAAVRALFTGDASQKQQAEARAADALAKAQGIPVEQARQQVQDYERQYDQAVAAAKQKAEAAAVTAKSAATQGAFYAALALVLGALAAFFGGRLGAPRPVSLVAGYDARRA